MKILKRNNKITGVRLRLFDELSNRYNFSITKVDNEDYYKVGGHYTSYSWNPSLRTIEVQTMFTPYETSGLHSICEGGLAKAFEDLG